MSNKPHRPLPNKSAEIRAAFARGDEITALRIAAAFPRLGKWKERVTRAWAAHNNPDFYRQLGEDPAELVRIGIAAVRKRLGIA